MRLERSLRCGTPILTAARAVVEPVAELEQAPAGGEDGEVAFWRCDNERAQAQSVAADVEALLGAGAAPESVCVLVRAVRREAREESARRRFPDQSERRREHTRHPPKLAPRVATTNNILAAVQCMVQCIVSFLAREDRHEKSPAEDGGAWTSIYDTGS